MILIVGSTGRLGGTIARRLLADGRRVRVLVRPSSNYSPLADAGAEPVFGDLKDPGSLTAACDGIDTVVTTANAAGRGGDDTFEAVDDEGNRHLIEAAAASRVDHYVFVSVLDADPSNPSPLVRAKGLTEERLRASGVTHTIIQPDVYMDLLIPMVVGPAVQAGRPVKLVGSGIRKHSFVAMEDAAAFTIAALHGEAAKNATIRVGGPSALSWQDIVDVVATEIGRQIPVESVAPGTPMDGLPDFVTGLLAALEMYDSSVDMTGASAMFGIEPTPLSAWVRRTLVPMTTA